MIYRFVLVIVVVGALIGCGRGDVLPESQLKPIAFNLAGLPTVEFRVPDMMCEDSCAAKVREILSKQHGAKDVIVDFDSRTATVAIEDRVFDNDAAIAALVDYGFDNSRLKMVDGAMPQAAER